MSHESHKLITAYLHIGQWEVRAVHRWVSGVAADTWVAGVARDASAV